MNFARELANPSVVLAQSVDATGEAIEWIMLAVVFMVIVALLVTAMANKRDQSWLLGLAMGAFVTKMLASLMRYYMVAVLYGSGDSYLYHEQGTLFASVWRSMVVPVSTARGEGTAFTEVSTGLIYGIYTPSMVGGFLMFAFLSFIGQLLFYAAFRPWFPDERLKLWALSVLFMPSLLFWPASIGKDALMVLFLGIATYGASRLLLNYRFSALLIIAPGLYLAAQIRPHVSGIWVIALVLAALFARPPAALRSSPKRALMIGVALAGVAFALGTLSTTFNIQVEQSRGSVTPTEFLQDVSDRTGHGGSAVDGGAVAGPAQIPGATIKVLFRPLLYEGTNAQVILSALEGTAMLVIVVWKFPVMWRNKRLLRENAMLLMAFFYTGGFVVAFSAINNLGILARQRVQVLPMLLALVVSMSWRGHQKKKPPAARISGPKKLLPSEASAETS